MGGVNREPLGEYLGLACVATAGGSWIASTADIAAGDWAGIRDRAKAARDVVAAVRE